MAVTQNGARTNHGINATIGSGVASTFAFTCPVNTDCLAILETYNTGAAAQNATDMSYDGVELTNVAGSLRGDAANSVQTSIWYLTNTAYHAGTGHDFDGASHTFSMTYAQTVIAGFTILVPLIGVSQSSPVGTATTNSGTAVAVSITPVAAGANDLQLVGMVNVNSTICTDPGGNQTNITNSLSRGSTNGVADTALGNASSIFSWTTVGIANWATSTVPFLSAAAAPGVTIAWLTA